MTRVRQWIWLGLLFLALWWILADGQLRGPAVILLTWVAALAAAHKLWGPMPQGLALSALASFTVFFVWHSLRGGVAVARLALSPGLNLKPSILDYPLRLPAGAPSILLADILSLLPGTVSAGLEGNRLRLHVLHAPLANLSELAAAEAQVARLFGLKLPSPDPISS